MSRPRRIMVIGRSGAGKTTLMTAMGYRSGPVTKTEAVCFTPECIDTPGEFLESPIFKNTFMSLSAKAEVVLLLMDPLKHSSFPPQIAAVLRAHAIGVVTKADIAGPESLDLARRMLIQAGAREVFMVSAVTGEGVDALRDCINKYFEEVR